MCVTSAESFQEFFPKKIILNICIILEHDLLRLRWSRGSVLVFGTQVRGFAPGRNRRIFMAKNILSPPSFGGEIKPSVLCRGFTAGKGFLNVTWESAFRQNYRTFLAHSSTDLAWWHEWRCLVAKFGTSNLDLTISLRLQCVSKKRNKTWPVSPTFYFQSCEQ
jgi:hypothetical protein